MSQTPRLSGAVFLDQLTILREKHGDEAMTRARSTLSPEDREVLDGLLAMSWLEADLARRFKTALADQVGMDALELQRSVVRTGIERTVRGFWRFMVRQLWDDALIKRVPLLYSKTFDKGALQAVRVFEGGADLALTGWPGMPDYDIVGLAVGIETVLTLSGRKSSPVRYERSGTEVRLFARWQASASAEPRS